MSSETAEDRVAVQLARRAINKGSQLLRTNEYAEFHRRRTEELRERAASISSVGQSLALPKYDNRFDRRARTLDVTASLATMRQFGVMRNFDEALAEAFCSGAIRLLDAAVLRSGKLLCLDRRQNMEKNESRSSRRVFLPPNVAACALREADRRVCFVSHAWRCIAHPDIAHLAPDGSTPASVVSPVDNLTLDALVRFLRDPLGAHLVGVFVDVACLHQRPRTAQQQDAFDQALKVMAHGYASPLGTTVARFADVPRCPPELATEVAVVGAAEASAEAVCAAVSIGAVHPFWPMEVDMESAMAARVAAVAATRLPSRGLWRIQMGTAQAAAEAPARLELAKRGLAELHDSLEDGAARVPDRLIHEPHALDRLALLPAAPALVRLHLAERVHEGQAQARLGGGHHETAAQILRRQGLAGAGSLGEYSTSWYNDRPYWSRGWCVLESAASDEMVARLAFYPQVAAALEGLPPKLVEIGGDAPVAVAVEATAEGAGRRIERITAALRDETNTKFTGKADRPKVVSLYHDFVLQVDRAVAVASNTLDGVVAWDLPVRGARPLAREGSHRWSDDGGSLFGVCKRPECNNFANVQKRGHCNACAARYNISPSTRSFMSDDIRRLCEVNQTTGGWSRFVHPRHGELELPTPFVCVAQRPPIVGDCILTVREVGQWMCNSPGWVVNVNSNVNGPRAVTLIMGSIAGQEEITVTVDAFLICGRAAAEEAEAPPPASPSDFMHMPTAVPPPMPPPPMPPPPPARPPPQPPRSTQWRTTPRS